MLREVGLAVLISGLATLAVLVAMSGQVIISHLSFYGGTPVVTSSLNNDLVDVLINGPMEAKKVEGYSYRVKVQLPNFRPQPIKPSFAKAYLILSPNPKVDRVVSEEVRDEEGFKRLIKTLETNKITSCDLMQGGCDLPMPTGKEVTLITVIRSRRGNQPYIFPDVVISLEAYVKPSRNQLIRALDAAAIGAVMVGVHYYYNRDEYSNLRSKLRNLIPSKRKGKEEKGR